MSEETTARWDERSRKAEEQAGQRIEAAAHKHSPTGVRILRVLIAALLVAFAVWVPAEIWSRYQAPEPTQTTAAPTR